MRYYSAAAGALDPALAKDTLAIALTDELAEQPRRHLVLLGRGRTPRARLGLSSASNFDALASKQGPSFRHTFASNLMANFADRSAPPSWRVSPRCMRPPADASWRRASQERILTDADFVAQQLPAIEDWIKRRRTRR